MMSSMARQFEPIDFTSVRQSNVAGSSSIFNRTSVVAQNPSTAICTHQYKSTEFADEGKIGSGGFGTVYRMRHRKTGRLMAVKKIRYTAAMNASEQKEFREVEALMRSANCPYIVTYYGAVFEEMCWICMELMDISLERVYKHVFEVMKEKLPENVIGKITHATLCALSYLKDIKYMHRDVKPSNILLDRNGRIKLCDLGIAGQLIDSVTKTKNVGCKPYMAPERLEVKKGEELSDFDVRSDVWSLGVTLNETAKGKCPFQSRKSNESQTNNTNTYNKCAPFVLLQQIVHEDAPLLTLDDGYSSEFVQFVNLCLHKDVNERPKFDVLLNTPFIQQTMNSDVDVGAYVQQVLDSIDNLAKAKRGALVFSESLEYA